MYQKKKQSMFVEKKTGFKIFVYVLRIVFYF